MGWEKRGRGKFHTGTLIVNKSSIVLTWLPQAMLCAANMTDFIPDAHTLLMVVQGVEIGKPLARKLYGR